MGATRGAVTLTVLLALVPLAACTSGERTPRPPTAPGPPAPTAAPPAAPERPLAPTRRFAVGVRALELSRGPDRPLPTTVWYPAAGPSRPGSRPDAVAARGRFPVVLFSHGLSGRPERYTGLLTSWAAAGFIVAAPRFPHTNDSAARPDRSDIVRQPADAAYVISRLRRLDRVPGHPLAGRINGNRVAAVGHSAGGYTTTGLFTAGHDPRLRAGVVIAGWKAPGAFAGAPASLLFVHGGSDTVVPLKTGRAAYDRVPWHKSFLVVEGGWHADYLKPGPTAYRTVRSTVLDFLRWTLYGDVTAKRRLPADRPVVAVDRAAAG